MVDTKEERLRARGTQTDAGAGNSNVRALCGSGFSVVNGGTALIMRLARWLFNLKPLISDLRFQIADLNVGQNLKSEICNVRPTQYEYRPTQCARAVTARRRALYRE
jgi:hypothetical protein